MRAAEGQIGLGARLPDRACRQIGLSTKMVRFEFLASLLDQLSPGRRWQRWWGRGGACWGGEGQGWSCGSEAGEMKKGGARREKEKKNGVGKGWESFGSHLVTNSAAHGPPFMTHVALPHVCGPCSARTTHDLDSRAGCACTYTRFDAAIR